MPKLLTINYSGNDYNGIYAYFRSHSDEFQTNNMVKFRSTLARNNFESLYDNDSSSSWYSCENKVKNAYSIINKLFS